MIDHNDAPCSSYVFSVEKKKKKKKNNPSEIRPRTQQRQRRSVPGATAEAVCVIKEGYRQGRFIGIACEHFTKIDS